MPSEYHLADTYAQTLTKTGIRPDSMRGRVLALMYERVGKWVDAQELADIIGITPKLGTRGGEPCTVKHVTAYMTAGILTMRMAERNCDHRLVVDRARLALIPALEEAAWRTHAAP